MINYNFNSDFLMSLYVHDFAIDHGYEDSDDFNFILIIVKHLVLE